MSLNLENTTPGYLIGRLVAVLEQYRDTPRLFRVEVLNNPLKLVPHLTPVGLPPVGVEEVRVIMDMFPDNYEFKRVMPPNDKSAYWLGYYQQQNYDAIRKARVSVGEQIRKARQDAGLSVGDLAEKCGLAKNHITRIEQGQYNITTDTLAIIGKNLGVVLTI